VDGLLARQGRGRPRTRPGPAKNPVGAAASGSPSPPAPWLTPPVARSDRALWKLYISDAQYGSLGYAGYADWPILEGRYTLAVLFEYAGTLGLFDLDYTDPAGARDDFRGNWGTDELDYLSRYDGLRAVRLNALGAYVLDLVPRYQPPADEHSPQPILKVLPNLDIVVTGDLPPADRLTLDVAAHALPRLGRAQSPGSRTWYHPRPSSVTRTSPRETCTHSSPGRYRAVPDGAPALRVKLPPPS
jgi:hypothetical protein